MIWVFISEIFPNRVRARGQAQGSFTYGTMAEAVSWPFAVTAAKSGGHTFAFYAVCMVGQLFWVWFVIPEAKGVSLNPNPDLGLPTEFYPSVEGISAGCSEGVRTALLK